jgi:exosortase/archaeosortase family protein
MRSSAKFLMLSAGLLFLYVMNSLAQSQPTVVEEFFCRPAAWLTYMVTGWPMEKAENGYSLIGPIKLTITTACSAISFFLLSTTVLILTLAIRCRKWLRWTIPVILSCYLLTILLNLLRILSALQVWFFLPATLKSFYPVIHLFLGVIIFLPALVASNWLMIKIFKNKEIYCEQSG